MIILEMHAKLGTRWAEIAKSLPGRSDNSVKNRWYSTCSRILRQQQEASIDDDQPVVSHRRSQDMVGFCDEEMPDDDSIEAEVHLPVEVEVSRPSTPTRSAASSVRVSSRNSVGSPRKRKAINQAPTPQKRSSGSSTRSFTADVAASEGKDPTWRGIRASARSSASAHQPACLKLPGGWGDLAVSLPRPGETVGEAALSAEAF